MKVILTGSTGFIGNALLEQALKHSSRDSLVCIMPTFARHDHQQGIRYLRGIAAILFFLGRCSIRGVWFVYYRQNGSDARARLLECEFQQMPPKRPMVWISGTRITVRHPL
ncbi:uncharacterized protein L3040_007530 [Drepanopeziza brunnea f. sp. 'multigermtubi']|uniref:uncharacterized protein n=1 Tax=Drepanopeziza brunnea f. sp. 'multigermtubi' TaxID=698441 RepID=UPI00238F46B9|nr:hypothetical protein L3040_007530 [Drepanopeziza brunnea f. sp. 'multigermtubi']